MYCPDDLFCRAAVYPRILNRKLYSDDLLLQFIGKGVSTRSLSLASRYLCRSEEGVHDFGSRVAEAGNQRQIAEGKQLTDENRQIYLGYYEFRYCLFKPISAPKVSIRLYWKLDENHDDRHFQCDIYPSIKEIEDEVDATAAVEIESALQAGKKTPVINKKNRAERLMDASVRVLRTQLASILRGPVRCPLGSGDKTLRDLQEMYLPPKLESVS